MRTVSRRSTATATPILEPVTVKRGKGYWLYATGDGVIIP